MEQTTSEFALKCAGLFCLIVCAIVAQLAFKNAHLDHFGVSDNIKEKLAKRLISNVYIFLALCVIVIAGIFKLLNEQVFLILFSGGLTSLGIKLISDLKDK